MALWCVVCEKQFATLTEFEDHIDLHISKMDPSEVKTEFEEPAGDKE